MTNDEIDAILMFAVDRTVYETLRMLRRDGGEPGKISEDPTGPILYESQGRMYRLRLETFADGK